ncbi:ARF1 [Symbiodinium pilosum]|uniref:ARF1 protein n=1 Tax=Symbiodinium pilosum TaxID=2952 RepID=A0A812VJ22_SYMPI|nr:ARF1 [Symbiodinium pilosum]
MLGLNGVGKTTALYKLRSGRAKLDTEPTMGLNVETIEFKSVSFALWDIGGNDRIRHIWKHHGLNSAETDAMIYVIDSADVVRMDLARAELAAQVGESGLGALPLLVWANKRLGCPTKEIRSMF